MAKKSKATIEKEKAHELDNQRRELVCRYYAQNSETFGNGTQSYAQAYGYDLDSMSNDAVYGEPNEDGFAEKLDDSPYDKACNTHMRGQRPQAAQKHSGTGTHPSTPQRVDD